MKEYLPIGSIVLLNNGTKKIMIYGRKQIHGETGKVFDYVACFYPEGNVSQEYTFLFNHEDIKEIVFEGYKDIHEEAFLKLLGEIDNGK